MVLRMSERVAQLHATLADRYRIEREVGRGGMATVYLARDLRADRAVAVKVLNADLGQAVGAQRFGREIGFVSRFSHPNILPVYDSGEVDGLLYYVMPYVAGQSLRDVLDREKQLSLPDALRITCEIAEALDYAHRQGVVHRDIKPENILLGDGHAIVADFGIARALSAADERSLTQTGVTLGTPQYMSPEQATADRHIDGRSDIYSLGCVLFELLAGCPPFTGPTAQVVIARHTLEQVPSLSILRGTIPADVEDAVDRALAKAPADRFRSAREFADALRACDISGTPTARRTRSHGVLASVPMTRRRRVSGRALAVTGLLLAAGLAAAVAGRSRLVQRTAAAGTLGFDPRRVAVLYFDDERGGRLAHLADGLTESLIDQMRGVPALDVVSRNGVAPYRRRRLSPDSLAGWLKAGTLVTGAVDTLEGRVRVTVRLVDGNSGVDLERRAFEKPAASILGLRDSLAQEVAGWMRQRVGGELRLREQRGRTRSAEAWTLLQQAERARKDAEERLAAGDEPGALALLARADTVLGHAEGADAQWPEPVVLRGEVADRLARLHSQQRRAGAWIDEGLRHADRALRLDASTARALQLRGALRYYRYQLRLDPTPADGAALLAAAEADLRAAVEIDPGLARAWNGLSALSSNRMDLVESKVAAQRAYEADVYLAEAPAVVWRLFVTSLDLEQFRDADKWCAEGRRRFAADPRFIRCRLWLLGAQAVEARVEAADVDTAWRLVEELRLRTPDGARPQAHRAARMWAAAVVARAGMADSARRVLRAARGSNAIDADGELTVAEAFVRQLLGDRDEALGLIKVYLSEHPDHRAGIAASRSWVWRDFHKDPRFQDLVGASRVSTAR